MNIRDLLADTVHNLGDAATAIPLGIAFLLARLGPRHRFPYGYGRVEDLAVVGKRTVEGIPYVRGQLQLPGALPWGYHEIHVRCGKIDAAAMVISASSNSVASTFAAPGWPDADA